MAVTAASALAVIPAAPAAAQQQARPTVSSVALVSAPTVDADGDNTVDTYKVGDVVRARVTFDNAVDVAGSPELKLQFDPSFGEMTMGFDASGGRTNTTTVEFTYTVAIGDLSSRGIAFFANKLSAAGGTIRATGTTNEASLAFAKVDHNPAHKVDGSPPTFASATVDGTTLTVVFDENLDTGSAPAGSAFSVTATRADGQARTIAGTGAAVSISGQEVTVTLASAVTFDDLLTVSYTKPSSNPVLDVAANAADGFTDQTADNDTSDVAASSTLVGNLGQTAATSHFSVGVAGGKTHQVAQVFFTGGAAAWEITSVDVAIADFPAGATITASIWNAAFDSNFNVIPTDHRFSLTNPATVLGGGVNRFSAPDNASLPGGRQFALVLEATGHVQVGGTTSDEEDEDSAGGWSILNRAHVKEDSGAWTTHSGGASVRMAIRRIEALSTSLTLALDPDSIEEEATGDVDGNVEVTVIATLDDAPLEADTTVALSVDGTSTAISGTDYVLSSVSLPSITIAAGQTRGEAKFKINPTGDTDDEGTGETVVITGTAASGTDTLGVSAATLTIEDNDTQSSSLTLAVVPDSIEEEATGDVDGNVEVTVIATLDDAPLEADTTVALSVDSTSTATSGTDYVLSSASLPSITITAGQLRGEARFKINPTGDTEHEGAGETVVIDGTATSGDDTLGVSAATLTIEDNDELLPVITLSLDDDEVSESTAQKTFTVTATRDTSENSDPATVEVTIGGDGSTAVRGPGNDYTGHLGGSISLGQGVASESLSFAISPQQDQISDPEETIVITGAAPRFTVVPATITIKDDETAPTEITLTVDDDEIWEDDSAPQVNVTATIGGSVVRGSDTVVTFALSGTAIEGSSGDYTLSAGSPATLTVPAGSLSATTATPLTVNPVNETTADGNKTIIVGGTVSGFTTVHTATIDFLDDDGPPLPPTAVTLEATSTTSMSAEWTAPTRIGGSALTGYRVRYKKSSVTAWTDHPHTGTTTTTAIGGLEEGTRYEVQVSATNMQGHSGWSASGFVTTPGGSSIMLVGNLGQPADSSHFSVGTVGATTHQVAQIFDAGSGLGSGEYEYSGITVMIADFPAGATIAASLWELSGRSFAPRTERHKLTAPETVVSGELNTFSAPENATLVHSTAYILVLEATGHVQVGRTTADGEDDGGNDTWSIWNFASVKEGSGSWTFHGGGASVRMAVISGFVGPVPSTSLTLSVDPDSIEEEATGDVDGNVEVTVIATLDGGVREEATTVALSVDGTSTAISGTDYELSSALLPSITIRPGQTSGEAKFKINPTGDTSDEGTGETVVITGTAASGDDTLDVSAATLTIEDNDTLTTTIDLRVDIDTISEGAGEAVEVTVEATAQGATRSTDTVVELDLSGTATEGSTGDYTALPVPPRTVTIPAGKSSGTMTLSVDPNQERVQDGDKTIVVGGSLDGFTVNPATITLQDDDQPVITLSLDISSVAEDETSIGISVTAERDASANSDPVTVEVTIGGDGSTAVRGPGNDYRGHTGGSISLGQGVASESLSFTISPQQDQISEGSETIVITGTASGYFVSPVTIVITDDEIAPTQITLAVDDAEIDEGDSAPPVNVDCDNRWQHRAQRRHGGDLRLFGHGHQRQHRRLHPVVRLPELAHHPRRQPERHHRHAPDHQPGERHGRRERQDHRGRGNGGGVQRDVGDGRLLRQ